MSPGTQQRTLYHRKRFIFLALAAGMRVEVGFASEYWPRYMQEREGDLCWSLRRRRRWLSGVGCVHERLIRMFGLRYFKDVVDAVMMNSSRREVAQDGWESGTVLDRLVVLCT